MQCCQIVSGGRGNPLKIIPLTHICTRTNLPALLKSVGTPILQFNYILRFNSKLYYYANNFRAIAVVCSLLMHEIIGINYSICPAHHDDENKINLHLCIDIYRDFINDVPYLLEPNKNYFLSIKNF